MGILSALKVLSVAGQLRSELRTAAKTEKLLDKLGVDVEQFAAQLRHSTTSCTDDERREYQLLLDDLHLLMTMTGTDLAVVKRLLKELQVEIQCLHGLTVQSRKDAQHLATLEEHILKLLAHVKTIEELRRREESTVLAGFHHLLQARPREEDVTRFFSTHDSFFSTHRRLKKRMHTLLKPLIIPETPVQEIGPKASDDELNHLRERLERFFKNELLTNYLLRHGKLLIEEMTVLLALYGSLVTGVASSSSRYAGKPTDYHRVSDIDLGLTIGGVQLADVLELGPDDCITKKHGRLCGPFKEAAAHKLGLFQGIFEAVRGVSLAGRRNRELGVVVTDQHFFKRVLEPKRTTEPYRILFQATLHFSHVNGRVRVSVHMSGNSGR